MGKIVTLVEVINESTYHTWHILFHKRYAKSERLVLGKELNKVLRRIGFVSLIQITSIVLFFK